MDRPVRRADMIVQTAGQEVMLYDPITDNIHVLNATAQVIWEMCDGQHTVEEMVEQIQSKFAGASRERVLEEVVQLLGVFKKERLLQDEP